LGLDGAGWEWNEPCAALQVLFTVSACSVGWRGNKGLWMAVPYTPNKRLSACYVGVQIKKGRGKRAIGRTAEEDPSLCRAGRLCKRQTGAPGHH
jgi:hypothetical protein